MPTLPPLNPDPTDVSPMEEEAERVALHLIRLLEELPVADDVRPLTVKLFVLQEQITHHL